MEQAKGGETRPMHPGRQSLFFSFLLFSTAIPFHLVLVVVTVCLALKEKPLQRSTGKAIPSSLTRPEPGECD